MHSSEINANYIEESKFQGDPKSQCTEVKHEHRKGIAAHVTLKQTRSPLPPAHIY